MAFSPATIKRTHDGIYHPTRAELGPLIVWCAANQKQLRVRGSGHSVDAAIYTDRFIEDPFAPGDVDVMLDRVTKVTFESGDRVRVEGGCHFGLDPWDPSKQSTLENSLFWLLAQRGLALPDTGGISHQTIGGFLSTGSSGGSVKYSLHDALLELTLVDGTGVEHKLDSVNTPDLFHAAGVSLGLFGVIVEVVFQCEPFFWIGGQEATTTVDRCAVPLFDDGGLDGFLRAADYTRLMWWPQAGVEKIVVWQAQRTGEPKVLKPYHEVPVILGTENIAEAAADALFTLMGTWPVWYESLLGTSKTARFFEHTIELIFPHFLLPAAINAFVPVDGMKGPQTFAETWWEGLPMDDQISDVLMPTEFTELWLPLERAGEVMRVLRDHYARGGLAATGTFSCEIYAEKASEFWLSPAYRRDVVRFDFFWFKKNLANPSTYFQQFWELLKPFEFRPHWGKHMPIDPVALKAAYPRLSEFLVQRAAYDPQGVFLTEYWRDRLF